MLIQECIRSNSSYEIFSNTRKVGVRTKKISKFFDFAHASILFNLIINGKRSNIIRFGAKSCGCNSLNNIWLNIDIELWYKFENDCLVNRKLIKRHWKKICFSIFSNNLNCKTSIKVKIILEPRQFRRQICARQYSRWRTNLFNNS